MRLFYEFIGGALPNRFYVRSEVEEIAVGHTPDRSRERLAGMLVPRKELDNQPKVAGFVGPMWDGERYLLVDGLMVNTFEKVDLADVVEVVGVIRYETQEVYNILSM
jgi:hypothetical protein